MFSSFSVFNKNTWVTAKNEKQEITLTNTLHKHKRYLLKFCLLEVKDFEIYFLHSSIELNKKSFIKFTLILTLFLFNVLLARCWTLSQNQCTYNEKQTGWIILKTLWGCATTKVVHKLTWPFWIILEECFEKLSLKQKLEIMERKVVLNYL